MRQDAGVAVGRGGHAAHAAARGRGDAVVRGEPGVGEGESRAEQGRDRPALAEHRVDEQHRLRAHRAEERRVHALEAARVGSTFLDGVDREPLRHEPFGEPRRSRVVEHPRQLRPQALRRVQEALVRGGGQRLVGHAAPEERREARRNLVGGERALGGIRGRIMLDAEQELGMQEQRDDGRAQPCLAGRARRRRVDRRPQRRDVRVRGRAPQEPPRQPRELGALAVVDIHRGVAGHRGRHLNHPARRRRRLHRAAHRQPMHHHVAVRGLPARPVLDEVIVEEGRTHLVAARSGAELHAALAGRRSGLRHVGRERRRAVDLDRHLHRIGPGLHAAHRDRRLVDALGGRHEGPHRGAPAPDHGDLVARLARADPQFGAPGVEQRRLRRRVVRAGPLRDRLREVGVALERGWRQREHRGDVVEARADVVRRQRAERGRVDAEDVLDRIAILRAVEPPRRRAGRRRQFANRPQRRAQCHGPGGSGCRLHRLLALCGRRHLPGLKAGQRLAKDGPVAGLRGARRERFRERPQVEVRLAHVGAMARQAGLGKEGIRAARGGVACGPCQQRDQERDHAVHGQFSYR